VPTVSGERPRPQKNVMQRPFPDDPQHWRLRAEEARVCAEFISDPQSKSTMMEIADRYEQIAARAEERIGEAEKRPSAPSLQRNNPTRRKRWF
jgi:hypothetical protein